MTLVKKMSICFALLCALVGGSSATPTTRTFSDTDTITPTPTNFSEFIKKFESAVFNNLKKLDDLGRSELLSMADGVHFVVPLGQNDNLEQEYKTVAIAVSKLLRNLKSMERTSESITNVTRMLLSNSIRPQYINDTESVRKFLRTILNLYIEVINNKFETDEELAAEYKKQKFIAKKFVERHPEMGEPLIKVGNEYPGFIKPDSEEELKALVKNMDVLREGTVNQLFLGCSVDNFHHTSNSTYIYRQCYLMARALIQKAQASDHESNVNEVYQKALAQTRPYVNSAGDNSAHIIQGTNGVAFIAYKNTSPVLREKLLKSIEKELALDPTLQKEIEVLMKQMSKSSNIVPDIDFDRSIIDFSPV